MLINHNFTPLITTYIQFMSVHFRLICMQNILNIPIQQKASALENVSNDIFPILKCKKE